MKTYSGLCWAGVLALGLSSGIGRAQTSAFTYQGRLLDAGQPARGSYDLQFQLADSSSGGSPVGNLLTHAPVEISNGLFTVSLEFGSACFDGSPRWLEIGVRTNGSVGAYTLLSPRQSISATPYAAFANASATAAVASNLVAGGAGLTNVPGSSIRPGTLNKTTFDAATLSWLGAGGSGNGSYVYVLPDSVYVWTNTLVVTNDMKVQGMVSTNLSPGPILHLDLSSSDIASAAITENVTITATLRPKPFWLTLTNAASRGVALTWPAGWHWISDPPGTLPNPGDQGWLSLVCNADTNVFATWSTVAPVLDEEATAFLTRSGITDSVEVVAVRFLAQRLKASGLWSKADAVYPFVGATAGATAQNLVQTNYPVIWGSGVTFGNGVNGNATPSGHGRVANFLFSASGKHYSTNSASLLVYCGTAAPTSYGFLIGAYDPPVSRAGLWALVGGTSSSVSVGGLNSPAVSAMGYISYDMDLRGPIAMSRVSATTEYFAFRGNLVSTNTSEMTTGVPPVSCGLMARLSPSGADAFSAVNLRGAWIGGGLTPEEMLALMKIFDDFNALLERKAP